MTTGLDQLTDAALAYLSLEDLLSELLDRIRASVHADTAAILLLDEERNVLLARAAKGIEEEVRHGVQVPVGRGFAGRVAAERRAIAIEDLAPGDVVNPLLRRRGIRSLLGVPLIAGGSLVGVLHVGTLERRRFTEDDEQLLQVAADRAALAIENARLAEQRATTELLQRTLLPEALPEIDGLRLSAKYLPAASGIKLGGDWYDVFRLPDERVAFVIGDVVGRGIVAASVMAEIRTALRAYLMEGHALPAVLRRLNELLVAMGRGRSATAAIFLLDVGGDELRAVSAGHLPALLLPPGEAPRFVVEAGAPPLGVHLSPDCASCTVPFVRGSALVLYTDGLVERRGASIDDQLARFARTVSEAHARDGLPLADRVFEDLNPLPVEDDVALLAIESLPDPAAGT
jgi:serine phosphatase RsbU (regulator of sigma subunit)